MVTGGEVGWDGINVMGTKLLTYDEPWVLYVSDESRNSNQKPVLHCMLTNWNLNKKWRKKAYVMNVYIAF